MSSLIPISILAMVAATSGMVTIPSGTIMDIRLTSPVSSQQATGTAVTAVVTVPVKINGAPALAVGTKLSGKTGGCEGRGGGRPGGDGTTGF